MLLAPINYFCKQEFSDVTSRLIRYQVDLIDDNHANFTELFLLKQTIYN
jgi:hypothetical protein